MMPGTGNIEELIDMRDEGLRCLEVAREKDDKPALTLWQNCISQIDAMIRRSRKEDFA